MREKRCGLDRRSGIDRRSGLDRRIYSADGYYTSRRKPSDRRYGERRNDDRRSVISIQTI